MTKRKKAPRNKYKMKLKPSEKDKERMQSLNSWLKRSKETPWILGKPVGQVDDEQI